MAPHEILDERRVAATSIRGYHFQFLQTALAWIALGPRDSLWCEGNEDIDRCLADGSRAEEQLKHVHGSLTEASEDIKASLLNFLKSFVWHMQHGRSIRFCFRTTANLGEAQKPLIEDWLSGKPADAEKLVERLRRLAKEKAKDERVKKSLDWLEANSLIGSFAQSITWHFGECDHEAVSAKLIQILASDPRAEGIDPKALAASMIALIASRSSSSDVDDRCLTRLDLDVLIGDALLGKVAANFSMGAGRPTAVFIGVYEKDRAMCVVAVRFDDEADTLAKLERLRERRSAHPLAEELPDLVRLLDEQASLDVVMKIDADIFAAFSEVSDAKRAARLRWLTAFMVEQARARAEIQRVWIRDTSVLKRAQEEARRSRGEPRRRRPGGPRDACQRICPVDLGTIVGGGRECTRPINRPEAAVRHRLGRSALLHARESASPWLRPRGWH